MEIWIKFTVRPRDLKSLSGSSETILWVLSRSKFCHFSAHNQFRSYLHVMYYHVLYPVWCMGLCVHTGNFTNVFTCGPCLLLSEVLQDKEKKAILSWRMYDISISEDVRKYLHFLVLSWLMRLLCAGVWYSTYFHNLYQINQTIFSSWWNQHFYACLPIRFLDKKEKHKFNISGSNIFLLSNIKTQKAYLKIKHF